MKTSKRREKNEAGRRRGARGIPHSHATSGTEAHQGSSGGSKRAPSSVCEVGDRRGVPRSSPGMLKGRVPQPSILGGSHLYYKKGWRGPRVLGGTAGALHLWGLESRGSLSGSCLGDEAEGFSLR